MGNIDRKISGVEKLFRQILPTIYPDITEINIVKQDNELFPDYDLIIHTNLPNTVTKDDFWDNEYWETNQLFDYHYMNDVVMPELLEYFSIKDREFNRLVHIYNKDNKHIISSVNL